MGTSDNSVIFYSLLNDVLDLSVKIIRLIREIRKIDKKFENDFNDDIVSLEKSRSIFLKEICLHDIVDDWVDIDCERMQKITYCSKCFMTF